MGKFSTYRYLELKDDSSLPHIGPRSRTIKQPRQLRKVFIFLVLIGICVTYLLGFYVGQTQWFDGLAKTLGYESEYHHAVIIDAGSSGTRVLAYKFRVPFTVFSPATNLELVDEYFEQSKPGLSAFASEPEKGAETVVKLIKKAEFLIPEEKRNATPLLVRATAGLRLLPADTAQNLIDAVQLAVSKLGYNTTSNSVQIMDGFDEGIYIWYTVNLLHNLIGEETIAALDLGGGSTQITYQLSDKDAPHYPANDQYIVPASGNNITLYTHSYLNLGLLAARYGIFQLEANQPKNPDLKEFVSVCVDPIIKKEPWTYANKKLLITGAASVAAAGNTQSRNAVYSRCHSVVRKYVLLTLDWEPTQAPRGKVAAMSFFYDVAADAGLIDVMSGGTVSVAAYRRAAIAACSASNVEQPWACIDLVYIVSLLHDAYKIEDAVPISLFKKVGGHEVSWALGLAYTTVMNRYTKSGS